MSKVERQPYLDAASRHDIVDQGDIVYPDQDRLPIKELPVYDGLACLAESCLHLCITEKRMQAHWRDHHAEKVNAGSKEGLPRCRPAKLQTFLRGNNLRYLVVSDRHPPPTTNQRVLNSEMVVPASTAPSFSRTPNTDPSGTEVDWLLTRHFYESTCRNLSLCANRSEDAWRDKMLQSCAAHPFLRYAVLSITASHVASRCVDVRTVYTDQASGYLQIAMDRMSSVAGVTADNLFAVLNFCRLMTVCCMAGLQRSIVDTDTIYVDQEAVVPTWISVQRQGVSLLWSHRRFMVMGLHEPSPRLLNVGIQDLPGQPSDAFDAHLVALLPLTTAADETENLPSHAALLELRRLWALTSGSHLSLRDAALLWTVRVPSAYFHDVQASDPAALLVLAHYCVLLRLSEEECSYARGMLGRCCTVSARGFIHLSATW